MDAHFVGSSDKQGGKTPPLQDQGTSVVVLQFVAIVRRDVDLRLPGNYYKGKEVRSFRLTSEEHYCLKCFGVHLFDVLSGETVDEKFVIKRCQHCGKEVAR